ncbi:hypothetical protein BV210_14515 [Halorientalis sp. IM1011]|uniref:hypothetical protein n=1 Tax=Halorientalis sp. IM1011 TaxID=1932360 RepID=UPI00097CD354|nr:hypothetical protein [Halorientalis sp. IM1011]AQL43842.1 hypothetical protein BV210_14515 [Halorientalis sp. IM1011]
MAALSESLPGSPSLRRALYAVGLVVLFRYFFEFSWAQVVVIAAIVLLSESAEIGREIPRIDERHARLALGGILLVVGGFVAWRGTDTGVAAGAALVGGWLVLDALYSLRAGIRLDDAAEEDPPTSEMMLSMQVGNIVAEELKDGPKTVPELAGATDMTESRVRDALDYHERAGTAYRVSDHADGDREVWALDESAVGPWAFVRDNTWRIVARLARPFRLFVPS